MKNTLIKLSLVSLMLCLVITDDVCAAGPGGAYTEITSADDLFEVSSSPGQAGTGGAWTETTSEKGTYCVKGFDPINNVPCVNGFDPANITCTDQNGNGWIDQGECSWGDTSTPWFANPDVNTQYGNNVSPGGSGASLEQRARTVVAEPHFLVRYYNAPSAPGTTATSGVTSSPSGSLREQHNEFGFEVVVDKKTDPLEPYYLKFSIPYTTVDSTQSTQAGTEGNMTGNATGIYSKEVTEMDPNNPGVFYRYTVTGTYTSTGNAYSSSSNCEIGCPTDEGPWPVSPQWP